MEASETEQERETVPEIERGQIITVAEHAVGMPLGHLSDGYVARLRDQARLFKAAKLALISATNDGDWHDQDGKPYLLDSGIQNLADAAGVEFGAPVLKEEKGEDSDGRYVIYTCELTGIWKATGRTHSDIGASSSRDPFYAVKNKEPVPFEKIRLDMVKKKAFTNAQHRVLTKLLGMNGLSWDQVEGEGIKRPGTSTRYKGSERAAATGSGQWTPAKKRIEGILLELHAGDVGEMEARLFKMTDNPKKGYRGVRKVQDLTENTAKWVLKSCEEEYQKTMGDGYRGEESSAPPPAAAGPRDPGQEG
jgi:hypothetical protein